ncbi:extracellular solute-binding protein [Providencia sp.]|uniref:extracellular solute-binding protein n=1 Tax=Providencia sp. TaxID=589 RepID=UPI00333EB343
MATMKDIARIAGVSYGTVSNVLNGRGNVSVEKMEAVLNAAKEAGYSVNTQAQMLRSNSSNKIAIVLPQLVSEKYTTFFNALRQSIEERADYHFDIYLTDDLEVKERKVIQQIASGGYRYVIAISCLNNATAYFDALQIPEDDVVFVYRKPKGAKNFFSLDYRQAAEAVCSQIDFDDVQVVGIYADGSNRLDSEEFVEAFRKEILQNKTAIEIITYHSSDSESYNTAFEFFSLHLRPDIIVTQDIEKMRFISQASYFGSTQTCPPLYTLCSNIPPMLNGLFCYPVNYAQLGQDVINHLFKKEKLISASNIRVPNPGKRIYTGSLPDENIGMSKMSLNLLTLPSPSTSALQKLLPNFYRHTGISVNLAVRPFSEIFNILSEIADYPYYDLLRVDVAFFPWFANQTLMPLEQIGDGVTDLLTKFTQSKQQRFSLVNGKAYSLPFDASVQLLFYRKDLFDDPVIRRMYFEHTGKELCPPQTFEEYDRIGRFFHCYKETGNVMRPFGTSATTGSAGIISSEYLLRYYAAGGKIITSNAPPQLNEGIALAVLNDYIRQLPYSERINSEWWSDSISHFENGNLAMNIAYMNLFNDVAHSAISSCIGFAPVPGGVPQVGGGALGVSKYSQKPHLAEQFLRWLYSDVIMDHIVMLGGNSVQRDFVYTQEITHRYPWLPMAYDEINVGIRESTFENGEAFNLRKAEMVIGRGVINAVDGIMSPADAISHINQSLKELN